MNKKKRLIKYLDNFLDNSQSYALNFSLLFCFVLIIFFGCQVFGSKSTDDNSNNLLSAQSEKVFQPSAGTYTIFGVDRIEDRTILFIAGNNGGVMMAVAVPHVVQIPEGNLKGYTLKIDTNNNWSIGG